MSVTAPCPTCQALIADCVDDTALYSIESSIFPFVFQCPAGFSCGDAPGFHMVCCGQQFSVTFPPGINADTKQSIINSIVNQCAAILPTCGQNKGCSNPPCDPPPPTTTLFYNRDATCSINCPDGTTFVYTVVAGTFADLTQARADLQAQAYACEQVALRRVCISSFARCLCTNAPFSAVITATGGIGPILFHVVSGALPDGLGMTVGGVISGTPTVPGVFHFSIKATTLDGGFNIKPFTLSVLEIAITSITGYTIGTPYSFQMLASGGSGMYQWSIASGTLPAGLTISDSGLISGTPTADGTNPVEFRLIDLVCEAAVATVYPPRITMATQSTTKIATVRGYNEFEPFVSLPPKRFHTASWSGSSEHKLFVDGVQIGGAKYDYSGVDHVNAAGSVTDTHQKTFSAQCFTVPNLIYAQIQGNDLSGQSLIAFFRGYYGMSVQIPGFLGTPNLLCAASSIPYAIIGDIAINGTFDRSDLWGSAKVPGSINLGLSNFTSQSSTLASSTDTGSDSTVVLPYCPQFGTVYTLTLPPDYFTPGTVEYVNNYSCTLLDEYTDAEALTNARVVIGNSNASQNFPRTSGFVSTFTNVVFTLLCTNLVENSSYLVEVDFYDLTAGTHSTRQYGFDGDSTLKHTITDTVPTPPSGHTIQVRNPRISIITGH